MNEQNTTFRNIEEKVLNPISGWIALICIAVVVLTAPLAMFTVGGAFLLIAPLAALIALVFLAGLKIVNPNEALVLTLFGKYYGTIKKEGFFFVNPFASGYNPAAAQENASHNKAKEKGDSVSMPKIVISKKISTKVMTFTNERQKVNDILGNPIVIGAIVIWRVTDPTKAVFNVDNYNEFLSTQCDSTIRNITRLYPYDIFENGSEELTLRGSSVEIAENMKKELQERVLDAGLMIEEVRITHLAYSDEIAAAMLQRQQAVAIIAARQKIVEGAVGMVKMALNQLDEEGVVVLDDERKAAMVSNLLVVLCGDKAAQPIVNSGSLY